MHADDAELSRQVSYALTFSYLSKRLPGIDVSRVRAATDALFSAADSGRPDFHPIELRFNDTSRASLGPLRLELEQSVLNLRAHVTAVALQEPKHRSVYVMATMEHYFDTYDFSEISATSLSIQDMGYQDPSFFDDLPKVANFAELVILVAFGNDIERFSVDTSRLTKLRSVDLSQNRLQAFPRELLNCRALEDLSLRQNPIAELPGGIRQLSALRYLDVTGTNLSPDQIAHLRRELPQCHVESEGLLYTEFEKQLNLVLSSTDWVILGNGTVTSKVERLPRNQGFHLLAALAYLPEVGETWIAAKLDSSTAIAQLFHRGTDGRWVDVTATATNVRGRYHLE